MAEAICQAKFEGLPCDCEQCQSDAFERALAAPLMDKDKLVEPRPNFNEFSQALLIAAGIYNDVELAFWLTAPQPLLEMWTPIQLLARGDGPELLRVMQGLEDGVYV